MQLPDTFNARTVQPKQGGGGHPIGTFDFQITNTHLKDTPADQQVKTGAMLVIEMTSPVGMIENRYNLINPSPDTMRISNEQLSALCHAINIFDVAFPKKPDGSPVYEMAGHTLRGGRGKMEIVNQMVKGPDGKMIENGYVKVNKVFDVNGNEPGKASAAPMTQQGGSWGNNQQQNPPQQPQGNQGGGNWGNPPQQQPNQNPPNQQQPQGQWGNPPGGQAPADNKPSWAK